MASTEQSFLNRVFAAKSQEESRQLYDQWAESYNADMNKYSFTAHVFVAEAVAKYLSTVHPSDAQIVDAGCGSGLVGLHLKKLGFQVIDGLDLSKGMLKVADKTRAYHNLQLADLTKKLDVMDNTYDALTCSGTFTHGHLGPEPLLEFVRVIKSGGIVAATVLESFWAEMNFEKVVNELVENDLVEVLEKDVHNYRKIEDEASGGIVLILKKL